MQKRIIARLNIHDGHVADGNRPANLQNAAKPVEMAKCFADHGADEILLNDVTASQVKRSRFWNLVEQAKRELSISIIVSGGIRSIDDIVPLRSAGCDKILITSVAVKDPDFVREAVLQNGAKRILVGIEPKRIQKPEGEAWEVHINGGRIAVGLDVVAWAKELEELGAGELILTFVDADRANEGFDLEMTRAVADAVKIGVAVSGDPGNAEDLKCILTKGKASAVLLEGDMGDYGYSIPLLKKVLSGRSRRQSRK